MVRVVVQRRIKGAGEDDRRVAAAVMCVPAWAKQYAFCVQSIRVCLHRLCMRVLSMCACYLCVDVFYLCVS